MVSKTDSEDPVVDFWPGLPRIVSPAPNGCVGPGSLTDCGPSVEPHPVFNHCAPRFVSFGVFHVSFSLPYEVYRISSHEHRRNESIMIRYPK